MAADCERTAASNVGETIPSGRPARHDLLTPLQKPQIRRRPPSRSPSPPASCLPIISRHREADHPRDTPSQSPVGSRQNWIVDIGAFNQIVNAEDACSSGSTLIWVFPDDALTAACQAEAIRRLADALGLTIVREYEDEECGSGPGSRPQFRRMMDEARSESRPFGAVIVYDRWRFAAGAADLTRYAMELQDAGVELLCVWNKPPRGAQVARDPAVRWRRAA